MSSETGCQIGPRWRTMKNSILLILSLLGAGMPSWTQGPRIFIVTDMEGVGGVNAWGEQTTPGQPRYAVASTRLSVSEFLQFS